MKHITKQDLKTLWKICKGDKKENSDKKEND